MRKKTEGLQSITFGVMKEEDLHQAVIQRRGGRKKRKPVVLQGVSNTSLRERREGEYRSSRKVERSAATRRKKRKGGSAFQTNEVSSQE